MPAATKSPVTCIVAIVEPASDKFTAHIHRERRRLCDLDQIGGQLVPVS